MSEPLLLAMGELLVDMFPDRIGCRLAEVNAFFPKPGGAPANVAVAASRLGIQSGFIGKVGADHFGYHLEQVLQTEGVDTSGLRFDQDARTTMAVIAMPDEHSAEFVFYRNPGADQRLRTEELDEALITSSQVFHVGSLSLTDEPARSATFHAVQVARANGSLVSYDVNYRPSLWADPAEALTQAKRIIKQADLVKVNEGEAALLAGIEELTADNQNQLELAAGEILGMGPALVVVTLGPGGCFYKTAANAGFSPGFTVDTVDAIGCGDAFMASLLVGLVELGDWREKLAQESLSSVLRFANAAGALTSTKKGAMPAMPTRAEVDEFLSNQN